MDLRVLLYSIISIIGIILLALAARLENCAGYFGGANHNNKKTALILSDNLSSLRDRFAGWNVITQKIKTNRVDFIYADGFYVHSSNFWRIKSTLKPRLDARVLFEKTLLHEILGKSAPHTICNSFLVTPELKIPPDVVWILKANWGWQGKGNRIVTNQGEMDDAIAELKISQSETGTSRPSDTEIIASEYIRDPMLYHGFKFHVRIYVIVLVTEREKKVWVKNTGLIAPAGEKYVDKDYENANIHDSHFGKNPTLIGKFPRDLPGADPNRINIILTDAFECLLPHVNKYPETKNQYDLYAIDIMLTVEGVPKILEINRFPASLKEDKYKNDQVDFIEFGAEIFDTVLASAAGEIFEEFRTEDNKKLVTRLI